MNPMILTVLAWRNVWRNPVRSLILIASIALGLWAGLFVMAFYQGMNEQRIRAGIEEIGHLQIHATGFRDEFAASKIVPAGQAVLRAAAGMEGVQAAARSLARGMLATARTSVGVEIRGVDPASEDSVARLGAKLVEGDFFGEAYRRPVVVGRKLAEKNGLKTGSKLVLTFQDGAGDMVSGAFRVAGIYRTSNARFDESVVYVPRGQLNALLGLDPDAFHQVALRLDRADRLEPAAAALRARFPALEVRTWKQVSPDLELSEASFAQILFVFLSIVLLGLAFGIVNTMLMAVLDRTRELGTLMALGMRRRRIFAMILAETVVLVLGGAPAGLGLAALTIAWTGRTGIDLSRFGEGLGQFGMASLVYPRLDPDSYAWILGMVAATALLASLPPARRALALQPTEALRSN